MQKLYILGLVLFGLLLPSAVSAQSPFADAATTKPAKIATTASRLKAPSRCEESISPLTKLDGHVTQSASKHLSKGVTKAVSIDKIPSSTIELDYTQDEAFYTASVTTISVKDDSIFISNFNNRGGVLAGTVNKTTGDVSFQRQLAYTSATYGTCDLVNPTDITAAVTGNIDEGVLTLSSWAIMINEGDYAGYSLGSIVGSSTFKAPNTTMDVTRIYYDSDSTNYDKAESYPVICEQSATNEITVYNFLGDGYKWQIRINGDKTLTIIPQKAFADSNYGTFFYYEFDPTSELTYMTHAIKGTAENNTLTWGGAALHTSNGKYYAKRYRNSTISLPFTLTYPTASTQSGFKGSGTESDPYLIENIADLLALSDSVNINTPINETLKYARAFEGKYFKQTANINAKGYNFPPIGGNDDYYRFAGHYDGNSKSIQNLYIDTDTRGYAGLFGAVDTVATIKNVKLTNPTIRTRNYYFAGALAGNCLGKLDNCSVTGGDIEGYLSVGGVAAQAGASTNCSFQGKISGYSQLGGVFAVTREPCSNLSATNTTIRITGTTSQCNVGGVIGSLTSDRGGKLTDSYFSGDLILTASTQFVGGVVGTTVNVEVERCFSIAKIYNEVEGKTSSGAGGIVGAIAVTDITDCYFAGENLIKGSYSGGIAGYAINVVSNNTSFKTYNKVTNCYVSGLVTPGTERDYTPYIGVFDTRTEGVTPVVTNCYYDNQLLPLIKTSTGSKPQSAFFSTTNDLTGFSTDTWVFADNIYPRLKGIESNAAAYVSAASIIFENERENVETITTDFKVSTANSVKWSISKNGSLVTDGYGVDLTQSTGQFHLNGTFATDTIVVSNSNNSKFLTIKLAPSSIFSGSGSETDPFILATKEDLIKLSQATNDNKLSFNGAYFKITNDIDLQQDESFKGIGCSGSTGATYGFGGILDGDNHYIHNIKMVMSSLDNNGAVASTGKGTNYGFVNNLKAVGTVKNVRIASDCKFVFYSRGAAVVGYNYGGLIENCRNYADVMAYSGTIGGITSYNGANKTTTAVVRNCYNAGNLTVGYQYVGGIVSTNYGTVENCVNTGEIKNDTLCTNYKVTSLSTAGGIAHNNFGKMSNVENFGAIYAGKYAGGILGWFNNKGGEIISSALNVGIVDYRGNEVGTIGNIVGKLYQEGTMENAYYDGQISNQEAAHGKAHEGAYALSTEKLTDGTVIEGLSTEYWQYEKGYYPILKAFADEPAVQAGRQLYVNFGDNTRSDLIKVDSKLTTNENLTLSLAQNNRAFSLSGKTLEMDPADNLNDTLVVAYQTYVKRIPIVALPDSLPAPTVTVNDNKASFSSSVEGVEYHYTIDGSIPTKDSTSYTGEFTIPEGTTVLKVISTKHNYYPSAIVVTDVSASGVDDVTVGSEVEKITYYTPDGIEVANPQYGIYIIVTKYTDGKTTVSKKILK